MRDATLPIETPTRSVPPEALFAVPVDGGTPTRYSPRSNGFGDNFATWAWQPADPRSTAADPANGP